MREMTTTTTTSTTTTTTTPPPAPLSNHYTPLTIPELRTLVFQQNVLTFQDRARFMLVCKTWYQALLPIQWLGLSYPGPGLKMNRDWRGTKSQFEAVAKYHHHLRKLRVMDRMMVKRLVDLKLDTIMWMWTYHQLLDEDGLLVDDHQRDWPEWKDVATLFKLNTRLIRIRIIGAITIPILANALPEGSLLKDITVDVGYGQMIWLTPLVRKCKYLTTLRLNQVQVDSISMDLDSARRATTTTTTVMRSSMSTTSPSSSSLSATTLLSPPASPPHEQYHSHHYQQYHHHSDHYHHQYHHHQDHHHHHHHHHHHQHHAGEPGPSRFAKCVGLAESMNGTMDMIDNRITTLVISSWEPGKPATKLLIRLLLQLPHLESLEIGTTGCALGVLPIVLTHMDLKLTELRLSHGNTGSNYFSDQYTPKSIIETIPAGLKKYYENFRRQEDGSGYPRRWENDGGSPMGLLKHRFTLTHIEIHPSAITPIDTAVFTILLVECPVLKEIKCWTTIVELVSVLENRPLWPCHKTLIVMDLTVEGDQQHDEIRLDSMAKSFYSFLAQFEYLQKLALTYDWDRQLVPLTLSSGLSILSSLKDLKSFDIRRLWGMRLSRDEYRWMLKAWPRLTRLYTSDAEILASWILDHRPCLQLKPEWTDKEIEQEDQRWK